jgi:hypothetical protein
MPVGEHVSPDGIAAVERFVADLIGNISARKWASDEVIDVWITDDPAGAVSDSRRYGAADETIEFRL